LKSATGKAITSVCAGSPKDVDLAVNAALKVLEARFTLFFLTSFKAYKTSWGLRVPASTRGATLAKLADLVESSKEELIALEVLNTGLFKHYEI